MASTRRVRILPVFPRRILAPPSPSTEPMPERAAPPIRVVHVRSPYLNLSETFIDRLVRGHVNADATVSTVEPRHYTGGLSVVSTPPGLPRLLDRARLVVMRPPASLRRAVRESHADILHAHFGPDAVRALPVAEAAGIPLVASFYGFDVTRSPRYFAWRCAYRHLADRVAHVTAVSEKMRRDLLALGFPAARLSVVRMGLDLSAFTFAARDSVPSAPRLLMVGRMVEKKGYVVALDALARLRAGGTAATLRLVGGGPLRGALEAHAARLGLGGAVVFVGTATTDVVQAHLGTHDVLLVPSVTAANGDEEGLPNTVIEGLASGIPVVGSAHSGIPEAVIDGETGLVVPEGDAEALAAAVRRYIAEPDLVARVSRNGRDLAARDYAIEAMVARVEAIYAAAIAAHSPRTRA